jgi:sugar phosphate isomerase/epimerase
VPQATDSSRSVRKELPIIHLPHRSDGPNGFSRKPDLQKALLSSFLVADDTQASVWPKNWPFAEKYMLMQEEGERMLSALTRPTLLWEQLRHFCQYTIRVIGLNMYQRHPLLRWLHPNTLVRRQKHLSTAYEKSPGYGSIWPKSTALDRLSGIHHNSWAIRGLAKAVSNETRATMVAVSTFFPEITSCQERLRKRTARSLETICKLAGVLNNKYNHNVGIIELVGGTLVDGIWPGIHGKEPHLETDYVANLLDNGEAIERIVQVLLAVAPHAIANKLRLALELEPGPLYVIRDSRTLEAFCHRVSRESLLNGCVGLNLDVAHWHLAGMSPLEIPPLVRDRIIHCHATDTHKGHCTDLPPGASNGLRFLSDWLEVLSPGYVTCELEACPVEEWLNIAHRNLTHVGVD